VQEQQGTSYVYMSKNKFEKRKKRKEEKKGEG
jgi:hypothetical protein